MPISRTLTRLDAARTLAGHLLADLPDRWRHTIGVAERAAELAVTVPEDAREVLLAAAWLHDIGYAPAVQDTGFHPLDGARYLDERGWPVRIASLVAHHSGAEFVARALGLAEALAGYPDERSAVTDALSYADQTTGPRGQRVPIRERLAETLARHGPDSVQSTVEHVRVPYLLAAAARVEGRLH